MMHVCIPVLEGIHTNNLLEEGRSAQPDGG